MPARKLRYCEECERRVYAQQSYHLDKKKVLCVFCDEKHDLIAS